MQDFSRFIAITVHNILLKYELDHAHGAVVQERNLLQLLIDAIPVNIYFKDTNSQFIKINKSSIKHYGLNSTDEIVGMSDFNFYPSDYMTRLDAIDALDFKQVALNSFLEDVITEIRTIADLKHLTVSLEPTEQSDIILGNETELTFVFHELIINAINNTPQEGSVHIIIGKTSDDIRITISDTGIGIETEALPHMFDRFYRLDEARGLVTGGAGLGLAIAKRIIELHDGTIQVQSIIGEGSQFTVYIPNKISKNTGKSDNLFISKVVSCLIAIL